MEYKNKSGPGVYKGISFVGYIHKIPALKLSDSGSYECEVEQEINGRKISNNKKIINYLKIDINYMKIDINYMKIGINYLKII